MALRLFFSKMFLYRTLFIFLGTGILSLFSCCNNLVEEPVLSIEMHTGYTFQLTASSNVQWHSSDPSVATVSSTGLVTAIKAGKVTISTHSPKGGQKIVCYLEVLPRRNILFYIATDTDDGIDGDTLEKIKMIRAGWEPERGEMLIYADRYKSGATLLRINNTLTGDVYGLDTLERYGVENSADADIFKRFITQTTSDYPADSYGLIFFSHASGWLPEGMFSNPRSLVIDKGDGTRHEMEYTDFAAAIPDKKFDFIILEACLMADVMSMYELRNKADYILASSAEIVSPGFEPVYKNEIIGLFNTKKPVEEVVSDFGKAYYNYVETYYAGQGAYYSMTLSLIKMSEMQNLATTTKTALKGKPIDQSTVQVNTIQRFDRPNGLNRYFDMGHVMQNLLLSEYEIFNEQLKKTVVWKANTKNFFMGAGGSNGYVINHHSGLTTYVEQSMYPNLNAAYKNSSWYKAVY